MYISVRAQCPACGTTQMISVAEDAPDREVIPCEACAQPLSTVGKLHAQIAQEEIGLGADDLSDNHVPVGGPPFGETT